MGEVRSYTTRAESEEALLERLSGAQAVVNMRAFTRFSAEVLERCPERRIISISGTGTDNVDLPAAARRGVLACNTPEANSDSVAEHTWALLLSLARGLREMEIRLRAGKRASPWSPFPNCFPARTSSASTCASRSGAGASWERRNWSR